MEFSKVCIDVNKKLKEMSLEDRVLLFKNIFAFPIDYKEGVFYYGSHEWDSIRMSDFLEINTHWLSVHEFDRIHHHFMKNKMI